MLPSHRQFTVKCFSGNFATHACNQPNCQHNSLVCSDQQCRCLRVHQQCSSASVLKQLKRNWKGNERRDALHKIYESYEKLSKLLLIEMKHVQKMIDKYELKLQGNEGQLYYYLVEGKSDKVMPNLVSDVVKVLFAKKQNNSHGKLDEITEKLEEGQQVFKKFFKQIRKQVQHKPQQIAQLPIPSTAIQNVSFNSELSHLNIEINKDNRTAKLTVELGQLQSAFVGPFQTKTQSKNFTITYRIKNVTNSYILFGICQLYPNLKFFDWNIHKCINHGAIVYNNNTVFLGSSQLHIKESNFIKTFKNEDLIEVQYEKETMKVIVRNKTENTQSVTLITIDEDLPLYGVVSLSSVQDEVQLVSISFK